MNLTDAILIATRAHRTMVDRAGKPYILHPLRVMLRMDTETERIVAVLHDVVEDTWVTLDYLRHERGFSDEVIEALDALTRREGEPYFDYILRVKANPLATKVKLADLADNLDPAREESLGTRRGRYERAQGVLRKISA